jgi:hypothetical protein
VTKITIAVVAASIGLAFGAAATANAMSKAEYGAVKKTIEIRYKVAKKRCDRFRDNAKDICMAEGKGAANVALAELEARRHPGTKARYDVRIAKAQAVYAVAREKCDDLAGSANAACVKETEAARMSAKIESWTKVKISKVRRSPAEKSALASAETR